MMRIIVDGRSTTAGGFEKEVPVRVMCDGAERVAFQFTHDGEVLFSVDIAELRDALRAVESLAAPR